MTFHELQTAMKRHVDQMLEDTGHLFMAGIDKDHIWNLYLSSFPNGTNPILRTTTEHDCSTCRHFIKQFGGIVKIEDRKVTTIWDFEMTGTRYESVVRALAKYVRSCPIADVFVADSNQLGTEKNFQQAEDGSVITWEHFHIEVPDCPVWPKKELDTIRSKARSRKDVFKRALDEISEDSVASVLELIAQNSLYRGEERKGALEKFQRHLRVYGELSEAERDLYAWKQSSKASPAVATIRSHSIGVLLVDISCGMELDRAVQKYEAIVAPSNYKRPKAIFTKKMLEDAEQDARGC